MKVGMLPVWDKWGERHAATVLHLDECEVVQVKTEETDGYTALKLGVGEAKLRRVSISSAGQFNKYGIKPKRKLMEFRVTPDALLAPGTRIRAMHFVPGQVNLQFLNFTFRAMRCPPLSAGRCMRHKQRQRIRRSYEAVEFWRWTSISWCFTFTPNSWLYRLQAGSWSSVQEQEDGRFIRLFILLIHIISLCLMPGHLGVERVTTQNLYVLKVRGLYLFSFSEFDRV